MKPDFLEIKHLYVWFENEIFKNYSKNKNVSKWIDPYMLGFNFIKIFSPIEKITWDALRYYGHAPFYPQYPVGKYFLDFGNPIVKVGIECDGKEFHQDKEKDLLRDTELKKLGWTIYRISGSDCNKVIDQSGWDSERDIAFATANEISDTIEGLIKSIGLIHFSRKLPGNRDLIVNAACACLRNRVSLYSLEYEQMLANTVTDLYNRRFKPFEM